MMPVLFRADAPAPLDYTAPGVGIRRRRPLRHRRPDLRPDLLAQLLRRPFLAAFDAGLYDDETEGCR